MSPTQHEGYYTLTLAQDPREATTNLDLIIPSLNLPGESQSITSLRHGLTMSLSLNHMARVVREEGIIIRT